MNRLNTFITVVLVSALLGLGTVAGMDYVRGGSGHPANVTAPPQGATGDTLTSASTDTTDDFSTLYTALRPSIVEVDILGQSGRRSFQQVQGQGSGIVLDTNGHILTNYHVVQGSQTISVTFMDGHTTPATLVESDPANDLAVIKTGAGMSELHAAVLGDSISVKVGNIVLAVGNPFGLDGSFSMGLISGLDRTLQGGGGLSSQQGLLQTDASINEGSSGGGLFNGKGELIGITNALENPGGTTFAGIAYAIPVNAAKPLIQRALGN